MPDAFADLELSLRRRDEHTYTAEIRFNGPDPDNDAEQRLIQDGKGALSFDFATLRDAEKNLPRYGQLLSEMLFSGAVGEAFRSARRQAGSVPLRIRLYIEPGAVDLQNLHWEALRDPERDGPLFTREDVPFSRYLASMDWHPIRSRPRGELKALVVIANPSDITSYGDPPLSTVPAAAELARARAAMGDEIAITALAEPKSATLDNIIGNLRDGYDILYLVCHGALIRNDGNVMEPLLFLEQADGTVAATDGGEFVSRLQALQERPRLVVLASCQSAGLAYDDPGRAAFSAAIGPRIAQAGIPAVLAMRGNISMETVEKFMPAFFTELRRDGQIDRAMSVARGVVSRNHDFWIPVLYMRLRSGRLWYTPGFGKREGFDQWNSICDRVTSGRCLPVIGADLSEEVFGSSQENAIDLANANGVPLSPFDRNNIVKVSQAIVMAHSAAHLRDQIRGLWFERLMQRFPDLASQESTSEILQQVVNRLYQNEDSPYRILAEMKQVSVYLTTTADPLLELFLKRAEREPREEVGRWRDERRDQETAPVPTPGQPLVFHLYGKYNGIEQDWVLTEDDFFDYLIRTAKFQLSFLPTGVSFGMTTNSLLFLGFPVDDWKFRVLFRTILDQGGSELFKQKNHVAVQLNPDESTAADASRLKRHLARYFLESKIDIYWGTAADFLKELKRELKSFKPKRKML